MSVKIILLDKTCKYHKPAFTRDFIFAVQLEIQFKKSHRLFVKGTRAMQTSGLAYKNASSLQRSECGSGLIVFYWQQSGNMGKQQLSSHHFANVAEPCLVHQCTWHHHFSLVRSEQTKRKIMKSNQNWSKFSRKVCSWRVQALMEHWYGADWENCLSWPWSLQVIF